MPENEMHVYVAFNEPALAQPADRDAVGAEGGFDYPDEYERHALFGGARREVEIEVDEFRQRWTDIATLVRGMFDEDEAAQEERGLHLDSIEASLTLTAKGGLALIAEASASASIKATFKRSAPGD